MWELCCQLLCIFPTSFSLKYIAIYEKTQLLQSIVPFLFNCVTNATFCFYNKSSVLDGIELQIMRQTMTREGILIPSTKLKTILNKKPLELLPEVLSKKI